MKLVIIGLFFAVFLGGIVLAFRPTPNPSGVFPGKVYACTVTADVGAESIKITNQNTPSSCVILMTELPFSFNFTSNDILTFNVTAREGFKFNAWFTNDGRFHNQNPYTVKATAPVSMRADFIPVTEEMP